MNSDAPGATPPATPPSSNSSNRLVAAIVALVVVVAIGGGLWWFFRDDAPDPVNLDATADSLTSTTAANGGTTGSTADEVSIDGTWTVDTESGDFDYESATGTFAGFRIAEELAQIGSTTAVGRTGDVSGAMSIEGTTVTEASFDIDLTTITTDQSRRDDKVQQALETDEFPTANFTLSEPLELGDGAASGEAVSVSAVGELTIHGVSQPATFALEAKLVDGTVVVVGSTDVTFADFGVEVPSSPVVLSVSDTGTLELQLLLVKES